MSDTAKKKPSLGYVIYFYAIATIQIILVHARMMRVENPVWVSRMVDFFDDYHMVLFFFIAGVLLSYTLPRHERLWEWYKGKLTKLICPFLILTILAFLPKVLLDPILHNGATISLTYILQVFFYPRKTIWGHFWFIPVYLTVMPLCFMLMKKVRTSKIAWGGVLLVSALLNYYPIDVGWFGVSDICRFLFFIILGITIEPYINREETKRRMGNWGTVTLVALLAAITYYFCELKPVMKIHIIVMTMLVLSISMAIEQYKLKWLETVGKNNMTIYIYSWPVQAVIEIACIQVLKWNVSVVFLIKAAFGLIIPLVMKWAVSNLQLLKRISGYIGF